MTTVEVAGSPEAPGCPAEASHLPRCRPDEVPDEVRALGGALFCDRRYGRVFTYHNGAQSYYAARGFRCLLRV